MQSTFFLANRLREDYPSHHFIKSDKFQWSPKDSSILYDERSNDNSSLLHELAHAILKHDQYSKDIELIEMERDAWDYAVRVLAPAYSEHIPNNVIEDSLDSYRDWLHARSTCPSCTATGIEIKKHTYKCVACASQWRVNDARVCGLRRYKIN